MDLKLAAFVVVFLAASASGHHHNKPAYRWIDLTYALNKDTVMFPGRKLIFGTEFEGEMEDGGWLASKGFCISEHTSTHIDSPYHFQKNGRTLSEMPIEDLLDIPGIAIDIYDKVHKVENGRVTVISNYVLTRQDILEWEAKNGMIPAGSLVLVRTGWGDRWPDAADYLGIAPEDRNSTDVNSIGDPAKPYNFALDLKAGKALNFPGFDASAAQFLSTERNVNGVGIDTLSLDAGNSGSFPAHKIFTKNNVYMIENVANLHLLPPRGFKLFAVPFKVDKGTGAPTRVLAKLPAQGIIEN